MGGGRGDYSREVIIWNIPIQGGQLIEGKLLFEEIWHATVSVYLDGILKFSACNPF